MDSLSGLLSSPRPAGLTRPAGTFFSARVEAALGQGEYRLSLGGQTLTVRSDLTLEAGQVLRLKLISQTGGRWLLQVVPAPLARGPGELPGPAGLVAAFVARGLPLAAETLRTWTRWVSARPGPSDKDAWAAALASRGEADRSALSPALEPWLAWQARLEQGHGDPPPDDDTFWDLWNSQTPEAGDPWLVMPLRWTWHDQQDAGLLQAHWNAAARAVDRWFLTAAPAGVAFRLEARPGPGRLDLTWHLFHPADQARARAWAAALGPFPDPDLAVSLQVAGPPEPPGPPWRGVDVHA